MPVPERSLLPALLAAVFLLPANIYVIADGIGAGLQCSFFRYQQTYLGTSLITLVDDLGYVTSGTIGGRSALSILLWALGTALLIAAAGYLVYRRHDGTARIRRPLALLLISAAAAYLLSCVAQYGPTLYGPAGFAVPVGVPLLLGVAGYIMTVEEDDEPGYEEEEEGYGEEEEGEE
ncbi:hypothetical protein SZ63_08240 [Methanoculleus sediminis]|uniref:Uncharacterized protein n=1 Tax=Methanoculleus sediminis TaxID=1550566 RepID=A0A0H1QYJ7_9EURY|nr:hypothetical protein [Methanoculleus sediminis]KLK88023.1 hypothetical protein SZ63_08240 [Methanoculleus sediminis]